jgi:hypothetical protein
VEKKCCIEGCVRSASSLGMCTLHYHRARNGKPMDAPIREVIRHLSDADRLKAKTRVNPETGCWEWQASRTPLGYGQVRFRGTRELAHRAAWEVFKGPIPPDDSRYGTKGVLHRCDNPCCINPEHLFLGGQQDNCIDSVSKGRWGKRRVQGEAHGRALITEQIVREIRESQEAAAVLSERYGISKGAIQHIRHRRTWKQVT